MVHDIVVCIEVDNDVDADNYIFLVVECMMVVGWHCCSSGKNGERYRSVKGDTKRFFDSVSPGPTNPS